MESRSLGSSDVAVSALALAHDLRGGERTSLEAQVQLHRFVAAGGTFIDTADVYSRGASEKIIGEWLKMTGRSSIVLTTKGRFPLTDNPPMAGTAGAT